MKKEWITGAIFLGVFFLYPLFLMGQSDTTAPKMSVTITSKFNPILRQSTKLNFSAPALPADTTRSVWPYQVPETSFNLRYTLRAAQPLAYDLDPAKPLASRSYVKIGYGNLRNPYARVGIEVGDPVKRGLALSGRFFSLIQNPDARDKRFYQLSDVNARGYTLLRQLPFRLSSMLGYKQEVIQHNLRRDSARSLASFPKDSIRQGFTLLSASFQLTSTTPLGRGISMSPSLTFYQFTDNRRNAESTIQLQAPLQKNIGETWKVQTLLAVSALRYTRVFDQRLPDTTSLQTLVSVTPSIQYQQPRFQLQAGLSPTWGQGQWVALPQVAVSYSTSETGITFLAGWQGRLVQNSYRALSSLNPWLWAPAPLLNTRYTDRYLGIKGNLNPRFSYDIRALYITSFDLPLFVNDTRYLPTSGFKIVQESRLNQLQVDAQVSYKLASHFSFSSQLIANHFFNLQTQTAAWGLLPLEWKTSMRVAITDELSLQSDLFIFRGARHIFADPASKRVKGAADLNAGLSFTVRPAIRLWTQFNNIFNTPYQRWSQNPVFGFNGSAGIQVSFLQKKKP